MQVLIVEDTTFTRRAIHNFLTEEGMDVIACGSRAEALEAAGRQPFAAAVVDLQIPDGAGQPPTPQVGLRLARELKERWPDLGLVLYSEFSEYGAEVLEMAARGLKGIVYCAKPATEPEALVEALHRACADVFELGPGVQARRPAAGDDWLAGRLRQLSLPERNRIATALDRIEAPSPDGLTDREREVLAWLAQSQTPAGIAAALCISEGAVRTYLSRVYDKLGLSADATAGAGLSPLNQQVLAAKAYLLYDEARQAGLPVQGVVERLRRQR